MTSLNQTVVAGESPAGWYPDPWDRSPWRWWDGNAWTAHVGQATQHKPRLTSWLSWPVAVAGVATIASLVALVVYSPVEGLLGIALGFVPLVIVLPVLAWLDRVEPEPLTSRIHAVLWGATVAGFISGVVNTAVAYGFGESWAAVASAPLVEEFTKGLGVLWAIRRREIDGVMDGIIYACWVALGFAVVENFLYFSTAAEAGVLDLLGVFVARALMTPFAHPLFTAWIGLAAGLAVARQQSIAINLAWGYGLAVACHACWNSAITFAGETGSYWALGAGAAAFFSLFVAAVVTVTRIRRTDRRRFTELVPVLADKYGLNARDLQVFTSWQSVLASRKNLPKSQREHFDAVHSALARLALFHRRQGATDEATEQVLLGQLQSAQAAQLASAQISTRL